MEPVSFFSNGDLRGGSSQTHPNMLSKEASGTIFKYMSLVLYVSGSDPGSPDIITNI